MRANKALVIFSGGSFWPLRRHLAMSEVICYCYHLMKSLASNG